MPSDFFIDFNESISNVWDFLYVFEHSNLNYLK